MAKPVHQVNYIPVNGYDVTNAFGLAMQGINQAGQSAKDWMQTESDIATGQAMNALAQADDPEAVKAILAEAQGNSWVDNKLLGESASKRKDRYFDEGIMREEMDEKLLAGEHKRKMDEETQRLAWANHALSAASTRASIAASNKSSRMSDLEYEIASTKWEAEKPYVEEDAAMAREAVRLKNATTASALDTKGLPAKSADDKRPDYTTASKASIENADAVERAKKSVQQIILNSDATNEQKTAGIVSIAEELSGVIGSDNNSTVKSLVGEAIDYRKIINEKQVEGVSSVDKGIVKYSSKTRGEANAKRASEWRDTLVPFELVASEMPDLNIEKGTFTTSFLNSDTTRPSPDDMKLMSAVFLEGMKELQNDPAFQEDMKKHMEPKFKVSGLFDSEPIGIVFNSRKSAEYMFNTWGRRSKYGTIMKKSTSKKD